MSARERAVAVAVLAAFLSSGCGAILHGSRQNIDVQSSPSGAHLETSPATGTYATPTTLNLERKFSYVLTFTSPGHDPATANLHSSVGTGTVIADVLLTGLIGVLVDGLTGAWYGLSPETVNVTLTPSDDASGGTPIHIQIRGSHDSQKVEIQSDAPGVTVHVVRR